MQVLTNEWTGLFNDLAQRLAPDRRKVLLSQIIGRIQQITVDNFGANGIDRPKPWQILSTRYSDEWKKGDRTPTLVMSDEAHALRNPSLPHLIDSFLATATSDRATLTNASPYADVHQRGYGAPERPYYPVNENGLTEYAWEQVQGVLNAHFQTRV